MKEKKKTCIKLYKEWIIFCKKLRKDAVSAYAGQLAFFIILSFFPFVLFLLALLQYTPLTEEIILLALSYLTPASFSNILANLVQDIYSRSNITLVSITVFSSLWLASKGFLTMIYAFSSIYDKQETRNFILLRIYAILYTLCFAIIILLTLSLLVFGNHIYAEIYPKLPAIGELIFSIISIRSIISICVLILFFLLLYKMMPNRKSTFLNELPGAILATLGWMSFSYLYSFYIDHYSNYSSIYGAASSIAFLMLWLYICMYILFFGAEINVLLQQRSNVRLPKQRGNEVSTP